MPPKGKSGKAKAAVPQSAIGDLRSLARSAHVVVPDMHAGVVAQVRPDVGPFNVDHRILTVGDGDLSFSVSLAMSFGGHRLVASTYDSRPEVHLKYPHTGSNVRTLKQHGATVLHSVDATKLAAHQEVAAKAPYDRIVFMFPHVGGATIEDIQINQQILGRFLLSSAPLLAPGGDAAVVIGLRNTEFYQRWKLDDIARIMQYDHEVEPFEISQFVGYKPVRTSPAARDAPSADGALFHILRPLAAAAQPVQQQSQAQQLSGKKRKLQASGAAANGDGEASLQSPAKRAKQSAGTTATPKPKGGYRCHTCQTPFANQAKLNGHLNSRRHAQKFKLLVVEAKRRGGPLPEHLKNPQRPEQAAEGQQADEDDSEDEGGADDYHEGGDGEGGEEDESPEALEERLAAEVLQRFEQQTAGKRTGAVTPYGWQPLKAAADANRKRQELKAQRKVEKRKQKKEGKQARLKAVADKAKGPAPKPGSLFQRHLDKLDREEPEKKKSHGGGGGHGKKPSFKGGAGGKPSFKGGKKPSFKGGNRR